MERSFGQLFVSFWGSLGVTFANFGPHVVIRELKKTMHQNTSKFDEKGSCEYNEGLGVNPLKRSFEDRRQMTRSSRLLGLVNLMRKQ